MTCTKGSSTYTCSINSSGTKGSYTAKNAPFVMPVNTSGYSAMAAPTSYSYSTVSNFIEKGIIYIYMLDAEEDMKDLKQAILIIQELLGE